jgi:predicted amidophosphoribosyltransferase
MLNGVMATGRITATAIPLWPLLLLGALGAWLLLHGRRRRIWASQGRCTACGYDLRETPDRCPECGEPFTPAGVASLRTSPM